MEKGCMVGAKANEWCELRGSIRNGEPNDMDVLSSWDKTSVLRLIGPKKLKNLCKGGL